MKIPLVTVDNDIALIDAVEKVLRGGESVRMCV